jgi:hypothetical protein
MKILYFPRHRLGNFNREWFGRLREKRAIHVAIRHPHNFSVAVVESRDYMRDIYRLSALIEEVATQHSFALRVGIDLLIHHPNHRVGRSGHQTCLLIHANVLDVLEADVWKIHAIRSDLLGQQDMVDFVEAALFVDRISRAID